jgi:hypothetical protein
MGLDLDDYSGLGNQQPINEHQNYSGTIPSTISTFGRTWKYFASGDNTVAVAECIAIDYVIGGVSLRFVWRVPQQ